MLEILHVLFFCFLLILQFFLSNKLFQRYIERVKRRKIVGLDVHKTGKPEVAEVGGVPLIISYILGLIFLCAIYPSEIPKSFTLIAVAITAAVIGLIDDLSVLGGREKPLLATLCALPLLFSPVFVPRVRLPFIGYTRLFIVYPLLLLPIFSVGANAVNQLDVLNGLMPSASLIILFSLMVSKLILGGVADSLLFLPIIVALLVYLRYNWFPSKIFGGDTGSLATGAILTGLAVINKVEFQFLIAFIPFIMNGFYIISSSGFKEKSKVRRPTFLTNEGKISVSKDRDIPMTLVSLVVSDTPLFEPQIVKRIDSLILFSSALGVLSIFL